MHDFVVVWSERALLLRGLGNTILLSLAATVAAFALAPAQFRRSRAPIPDDPEQSHVRPSRAVHEGTIGCVSLSVNFLGVSQDRERPSP